jgi:hypothetical protein
MTGPLVRRGKSAYCDVDHSAVAETLLQLPAMRTWNAAATAWILGLAGCASEPPCTQPEGSVYRTQLRELSGDCGPMDSRLESVNAAEVPGCMSVDLPTSGEGCRHSYQRRCVTPDGTRGELLVTLQRQDDDETWSGTADLRLFERDSSVLCHSLYAITFSPQ